MRRERGHRAESQLIAFERTRDLELVRRAVAEDARVWRASTDDFAPRREDWRPADDERIWYVLARDTGSPGSDAGEVVAAYTLLPQNTVCYELHATRLFGRAEAAALRGVIAWAFERVPGCRRIVASLPVDNRIAIRAARRAGMTEYGRNPASILRRGQLMDQVLLGTGKP